jgi:hypothetical protein
MAKSKEQFCVYCGESCGVFAHSQRLDGPVVCGGAQCNRDARDDYRTQLDDARERAEQDGYDRYGGPGGW